MANCTLAERFTPGQKVYAQVTFFTFTVAATVGIARADWPWVIPYALVCWYGVPGIVMRHLTCPRCEHLHYYGDCLQFPAKWTRWIVAGRNGREFSAGERRTFVFIFLFLPLYPVPWLLGQPALLVLVFAGALLWYGGQWFYFCRRCRVKACPMNRVT